MIVPGIYKLQTQVAGSSIEVVNSSGGNATVLDAGSTNGLNNYFTNLSAGVYELRFTNVGSQQAQVRWLLTIQTLDWEKIIDNGVSQSSALSLMTFAPTPASPGTVTGLLSIPPSAVGDAFGGSVGPVPSSLLVTLNSSLAGQPSWDGQALSGAGPLAESGAIAASGGATGQAAAAGPISLFTPGNGPENDNWGIVEQPVSEVAAGGAPIGSTAQTRRTRRDLHAASTRADIRALDQAEWVNRIGSMIQDLLPSAGSDARSRATLGDSLPPTLAVADQPGVFVKEPALAWRNRPFRSMLRTEIGAAVGMVMFGAAAYRMRHPLRKWWQEKRQLTGPGNSPKARALSGPHRIPRVSRVKTLVRKP